MRWRLFIVVLGALCVGFPATALAHNGVGAAFKGHAGRYTVYAYDAESLADGRLDYKLVLLNGKTKSPVYDVHPTVTATRPGAPGTTARITTFGNVVFYNLPNPYPHDWNMQLHLTGPLGTGDASYRMHGVATTAAESPLVDITESGSSPWPVVVGATGTAMLLAAGTFFLVRRSGRRRRASPR